MSFSVAYTGLKGIRRSGKGKTNSVLADAPLGKHVRLLGEVPELPHCAFGLRERLHCGRSADSC